MSGRGSGPGAGEGAAPVALVTAASRGMGAAVARRLAADGYRVALMARSESVHRLAEELGGIAFTGSVADPVDLRSFVDHALSRWARIDAVVCNTGHPPKGDLLSLGDDDWHAGLDLVFLLTVRLARWITPRMVEAGGGAFVNISTFGAREPSLDFPVSSALRAALGAFTRLHADRFGPAGVRMNSVLPGFVETYPVDEETLGRIPLGRPGTVDEIAGTVAWLLSPDGAYVNGQNIAVDGGLTRAW